ncbi:MAG: site-specific integrase [Candidatus Methanoplasma sp.]|jgi:integrase|nr:site-specific integrase [Candidatus Methanoplasma sp.]
MVGRIMPPTIREHLTKIKRFDPIFEELFALGKISGTDPRSMTEREVRYFVQALRDRGIEPATIQKYLQILNGYLSFIGNRAVDEARCQLKISAPRNPIHTLTVDEIGKIFLTIDRMKGWGGSLARGLIHLAFQTLARPSEILLAQYSDIDMTRKRFYIRNPKGAGSYAVGQWVDMLRPDFYSEIERYLREREIHLRKCGKDSIYLFPNIRGEINTFYSSNALRIRMREVSQRSGVDFSLKTFRATGADLFVSADLANLYAISSQLRHSNVATTQRYYADIQKGHVRRQLGDTYEKISIPIPANKEG